MFTYVREWKQCQNCVMTKQLITEIMFKNFLWVKFWVGCNKLSNINFDLHLCYSATLKIKSYSTTLTLQLINFYFFKGQKRTLSASMLTLWYIFLAVFLIHVLVNFKSSQYNKRINCVYLEPRNKKMFFKILQECMCKFCPSMCFYKLICLKQRVLVSINIIIAIFMIEMIL